MIYLFLIMNPRVGLVGESRVVRLDLVLWEVGVGKIGFGLTRSGFGLFGLDKNESEQNPNY